MSYQNLTPLSSEERTALHLKNALDSVTLINQLVSEDVRSREIYDRINANILHLEIILARDYIIADSTDKTVYTDAILAGQAFVATLLTE
jgi:hypothetical protein